MACRLLVLLSLMLASLGAAGPAMAAKRVALVVGIDSYPKLGARARLERAVKDAESIAAELVKLGFDPADVIFRKGAERREIIQGWNEAISKLEPGGVAFFFFAGHGIEIQGTNYLLASDSPPLTGDDPALLATDYLRFEDLLLRLRDRAKNPIGIFVVDACRDDPFVNARGAAKGLAPIQPPGEMFVMYSAGAGQSALDRLTKGDTDPNSVYTRILLKKLLDASKATSLADLAQDVRIDVYNLARSEPHFQTPAYYDQFTDRRNVLGEPLKSRSMAETVAALNVNELTKPLAPTRDADAAQYRPGAVIADCSGCPELAVVPAGLFDMGSAGSEPGHAASEEPVRTVKIPRSFALGRFEVTNAEWNLCVKAGKCKGYRGFGLARYYERKPVTDVSWKDAADYVGWLSEVTGQRYRLPTEAEWEYAARADGKGRFGKVAEPGKEIGDADICQYANGADQSLNALFWTSDACNDRVARGTAQVGSYKPNAFGLHDMHGNVWEWTADCWHDDYRGAPADGSTWTDGRSSCSRVARGGSWRSMPAAMRSAARNRFEEMHARVTLGFRVARELQP